MRVLILQHLESEPAGVYEDVLAEKGPPSSGSCSGTKIGFPNGERSTLWR